ncbi:MAG TPA: NUDIX domain-containing protein [Novosphingobium sp.]
MRIAVALLHDDAGRLLLVRKQGTAAFMQPGGKIEPGEEARSALVRELQEELSLVVVEEALEHLGRAEAPAANEPGVILSAEIFALRLSGTVAVQAEIAEAVWVDPVAPGNLVLAPLTRDHILPLARIEHVD